LTKYITPNGQKQTVTLPLSDYTTSLVGGRFDMSKLKDWTIVNLSPGTPDTVFVMSNLVLKGGPSGCTVPGNTTTTTSTMASAMASATATTTSTSNNNNDSNLNPPKNDATMLVGLSGLLTGLMALLL
jgi:hypothetical protein